MLMFKKQAFWIMALAIMTNSLWAASEPASHRRMEISFNPASLLSGELEAAYRFAVSHNVAFGLHLNGLLFSLTKEAAATGLGGGLSAKFFLTRDAFMDGWWVEPALYTSRIGFSGSENFWRLSPRVIAGYGWVWPNGFSLNLGLGVAYNHAFAAANPGYPYNGFWWAGDFSIGYAW